MSEVQAQEVKAEEVAQPELHKFSQEFAIPAAVAEKLTKLSGIMEQAKAHFLDTLQTAGSTLEVPQGFVPVNNFSMFVPLEEVQVLIAQIQEKEQAKLAAQHAEQEQAAPVAPAQVEEFVEAAADVVSDVVNNVADHVEAVAVDVAPTQVEQNVVADVNAEDVAPVAAAAQVEGLA